jgi:hypothetical protein
VEKLTGILRINCGRILHEINLETDEMGCDALFVDYRDHGQEIHEWLPPLAIIDQTDLRLFLSRYAILQVKYRIVIAVFALDARCDFAIGRLEETAVLPNDFVPSVAC